MCLGEVGGGPGARLWCGGMVGHYFWRRPLSMQAGYSAMVACTVEYRADAGVLHTVRSTKSSCLTMLRRMDRVQQKVSHCRHLFASCLAECIEAFSAQAPRRPSFAKTGRHRDNPAHFGPHYLLLRRLLFICLPLIGSLGLFPYRTRDTWDLAGGYGTFSRREGLCRYKVVRIHTKAHKTKRRGWIRLLGGCSCADVASFLLIIGETTSGRGLPDVSSLLSCPSWPSLNTGN